MNLFKRSAVSGFFSPSFLPTLDFRVRSLLLCMSCNGVFFSLSGLLSLQSVCVVEPNYTLISRPPSFICILWLTVEGGIRADESEGVRVLTDSHKLMHLRSRLICKHSSWWMTVPRPFWRTSLCWIQVLHCVLLSCQWWIQVFSSLNVWVLQY